MQGRSNEAKGLIDEGVDVESRNEFGLTPLMYAGHNGHVDMVQMSIQRAMVAIRHFIVLSVMLMMKQ